MRLGVKDARMGFRLPVLCLSLKNELQTGCKKIKIKPKYLLVEDKSAEIQLENLPGFQAQLDRHSDKGLRNRWASHWLLVQG